MIRERPHRLDPTCYRGITACAFTCCVDNRGKLFVSEERFLEFEQILLEALSHHDVDAHVYLFMPDHLHLLVEGKSLNADLQKAIVRFKQVTGYQLAQKQSLFKWQKDFYDHVMRKDEDVRKQVLYILNNPVRAGIVKTWTEYPFKGSTMYDLNKEFCI